MKRNLLTLLICTCACVCMRAQGLEASVRVVAGYNATWGAYTGADYLTSYTFREGLKVALSAETTTAKVHDVNFSAVQPIAIGSKGRKLFMETAVNYTNAARNDMYDFVLAASAGYRSRHILAQAGLFSRTMREHGRDIHTDITGVEEPFNLLYRLQFMLGRDEGRWSFEGGMTNATEFAYERMWQPLFFGDFSYKLADDYTLTLQTLVLPAGMFHLDASFYGIVERVGFIYRF